MTITSPELTILALVISLAAFATQWWFARKSAKKDDMDELRRKSDELRLEHDKCQEKLRSQDTQIKQLQVQYFYLLEAQTKRISMETIEEFLKTHPVQQA